MKRSFLLLCAVLLVLGCALPCAAYRLARMTLAQSNAPSAAEASSAASEEGSGQATSPADTADTVRFTDQSTGQAMELPLREYLIGAAFEISGISSKRASAPYANPLLHTEFQLFLAV